MRWIPDYVGVSGAVDFMAIKRQVMGHSIDQLTVLIREFAQNSWDARQPGRSPIRFEVDGWQLSPQQKDALASIVFPECASAGLKPLSAFLSARRGSATGNVICIADFGTKGLEGPLDPRVPVPRGVEPRWTSYVHNVGQQQQGHGSGGAFGLGRTSSFGVSKCMAIVIYSRTVGMEGAEESRLIAIALGDRETLHGRNVSGRHFWGVRGPQDLAQPVIGERADRIATLIGLSKRSAGDLGLSVLILDPDTGVGLADTMTAVRDSVLWNLWPKMLAPPRGRQMDFAVRLQGNDLVIPEPRKHPVLRYFAKSLDAVRVAVSEQPEDPTQVDDTRVFPVVNKQGHGRLMGYAAFTPFPILENSGAQPPNDAKIVTGALPNRPHHVMLARVPELVVTYVPFPEAPLQNVGWAGVFRPLPELDDAFKASEPVAHDAWLPSHVPEGPGRARADVRFVMGPNGIERAASTFLEIFSESNRSTGANLRRLARMIADQLITQPRGKADQPGGGEGSGGGGNGTGQSTLGAIRITRTEPAVAGEQFVTQWEAEWDPKRTKREAELVVEVAPAGFRSNEDANDGMLIDPELEIVAFEVDDLEIDHGRYRATATLNGSDPLKIKITVKRSENTAVRISHSLRRATNREAVV